MNVEVARNEALMLMNEHGLLDDGWKFKLDGAKRRFGLCMYRTKVISLSKALVELNEFDQVKDTILHEIAHALVGAGHGHDNVWRRKALEIGCNGKRCYSAKEVTRVKGKYIAICNTCKNESYKFKKPSPRLQYSCGKCSKVFDPNNVLTYTLVQD